MLSEIAIFRLDFVGDGALFVSTICAGPAGHGALYATRRDSIHEMPNRFIRDFFKMLRLRHRAKESEKIEERATVRSLVDGTDTPLCFAPTRAGLENKRNGGALSCAEPGTLGDLWGFANARERRDQKAFRLSFSRVRSGEPRL